MRRIPKLLFAPICLVTFILLGSCRKLVLDKGPASDAVSSFEYLWKEANDKYAYFEYKQIDWNAIHDKYRPRVYNGMSKEGLFDVLADMLNELRDAHVNLISPFNISNYFPVFLNSPENIDERVVLKNYLLKDPKKYYQTGSLANTLFDVDGASIGYIRYSSFMSEISNKDLDYVLTRMENTDGLILDMRNNGGGYANNVFVLGSRFTDSKRKVFVSAFRKGPDKNNFEFQDGYFEPSEKKRYTKKIVVLTNRGSYSATSFFALAMRSLPNVKVIGDTTGGGLGVPNGGELPNGWTYRFSVSRTLSTENDASNMPYNWENGVPPHITVALDKSKLDDGIDTIIERAMEYIKTGN